MLAGGGVGKGAALSEAKGRVAVITGSTRGIGKAIALKLAQEGCLVALNYLSNEKEARKALEAVKAFSPEALAIKADVSKPDGAKRLIEETLSRFRRLDILVNNVGPFLVRSFIDTRDDDWRYMIDSNLSSVFYCTRNALRPMRERRSGNVINIGALNVEHSPIGVFEAPAYSIAKAGIIMLTRSLARSEAPYNIRVNAINPGFIETETYARYREEDKAAWAGMIPLGHFGKPEDVAEAVSFLVSEKARYITGAVLHIHGGLWL